MKTPDKMPRFLVVNKTAERRNYNKYLPHPYKEGEIVQVDPDQSPGPNDTLWKGFRRRFVRIRRRDSNGKWSLTYVADWEIFDHYKPRS